MRAYRTHPAAGRLEPYRSDGIVLHLVQPIPELPPFGKRVRAYRTHPTAGRLQPYHSDGIILRLVQPIPESPPFGIRAPHARHTAFWHRQRRINPNPSHPHSPKTRQKPTKNGR